MLQPSALTPPTWPDYRRSKEDVLQWLTANGVTHAVVKVPHQQFQLEPDGRHRALRLGHSALVAWRPAASEAGNGFDGIDQFHVVLAVLLQRPRDDRVGAPVRAAGLARPSPAGLGRLHAPAGRAQRPSRGRRAWGGVLVLEVNLPKFRQIRCYAENG